MEHGFELLEPNHAGILLLKNGATINYGAISRDDKSLVHYTGKGLKKIFSPDLSENEKVEAERIKRLSQKELIKLDYVGITPLSSIEKVLS